MSVPDTSPAQPEPRRAYKPRKSTKSSGIKSQVITRRINGQSKRMISQQLGMTRNTVTNILEEANIEQAMRSGTERSVNLIYKALNAVEGKLDKGDANIGVKLLENTIWPINGNNHRGMKPGDQLFLSIQNLIQPQPVKPLESAIECVSRDTTPPVDKP